MGRLRLFRVNIDYIKYLYCFDKKIQYDIKKPDAYTERRPYVGTVININNFQYFAPLEHPRESHKTLKSNPHILKINNGRDGLIAFGNMIPIKNSELINFDIKKETRFYQDLLNRQLIFCNNSKLNIQQHAIDTYNKVVVQKSKFFKKNCCDFKLLEEKCLEYQYSLQTIKEVAVISDESIHINNEEK